MNLQEFRDKSLRDFGLAEGLGITGVSQILLFRWPVAKATLHTRGLYDPGCQMAVERVALAYSATTKPAPRNEFGTRCLDISLAVPRFLQCSPSSCPLEAVVRITRHRATHEPFIVTAFVRGVTGEPTRAIFAGVAASLHDSELVSLADRMSRLDYVNGKKR